MLSNAIKEKAKYYANLPYTIAVERFDDQGVYYVARYIELPHFIMTGSSPEEAVRELESEKLEWFELNLEEGNKIPLPLKTRKYSGKIILRMSPKLHAHLIEISEFQGTSLNNFMVKALSQVSDYSEDQRTQAVCKQ